MPETRHSIVDYGEPVDMTKNIIKVIGVGGGGCNAVRNMFEEGISDVSFAVCNTDSKSLSHSPVPVRVLLGKTGLGVGGVPERGRDEAEESIDEIKKLFSDETKMVFITAGMGGGTGTGAGPVVASVAKEMGMLTIGVVTIPFYFEKEKKIIKALKGVEEMRKSVDALLIVNNERLCEVYSDTRISVKDAFKYADNVLGNAVKSISELITIEGDINLDFRDVETTMKGGGGAIMAIGRAGGEHRVEKAIVNALDSPLLYGCDVSKAKRILFNIYTNPDYPLFVDELQEIDAFMDELSPQIEVIWGVSDDDTIGEDAKIAILATGLDDEDKDFDSNNDYQSNNDDSHYRELINKLYSPGNGKGDTTQQNHDDIPVIVTNPDGDETPDDNKPSYGSGTTGTGTEANNTGGNGTPYGGGGTTVEPDTPQKPQPAMTFVERLKKLLHDALKE